MRLIRTEADIAAGLAHLLRCDRRLRAVAELAGPVPLRRLQPGFPGLARIVVGQQLSVASAAAIWGRLAAAFPGCPVEAIAGAADAGLAAAGLSRAKIATLRRIAAALGKGLDLDGLATVTPETAHARLTAIPGIGPWTADLYLLFCLGHADIFPAGDLALRKAVGEAFGEVRPVAARELAERARRWSPWRGVAARLFFAYYRARRGLAAVP
jgi:DNA-3-methyladenine glycosylase II